MSNTENSLLEDTFDPSICRDSFDKIVGKRSVLRKFNVIKSEVRTSFNMDSSIENSDVITFNEKTQPKIGKSISTPLLSKKSNQPFRCGISPITAITAWELPNFVPTKESSPSCISESQEEQKENIDSLSSVINNLRKRKVLNTFQGVVKKQRKTEKETSPWLAGKWRKSLIIWKRQRNSLIPSARVGQRQSMIIKLEQTTKKRSTKFLRSGNDIGTVEQCKDLVFKICKQKEVLSFCKAYSKRVTSNCKKIGEGAFGEVFLNKSADKGDTVLKIIPIEGTVHINGEAQKTFKEILPEIIITTEMSNLRKSKKSMTSSFVELKKVTCVRGKYPDQLQKQWNIFNEKYCSENDDPSILTNDQLYIILELSYGGTDLESYSFKNAEQSYSAFLQITVALAAAEQSFQFEHRDLHWGNILISPTDQENIEYIIESHSYTIPTKSVKVTIIDYTLSRILYENCILYNDLSHDDDLFNAEGDQQFEVYRQMRNELKNNWDGYSPKTNILWLSYILGKMIKNVKYSCKRSEKHTRYLKKYKNISTKIMDLGSAHELALLLLN